MDEGGSEQDSVETLLEQYRIVAANQQVPRTEREVLERLVEAYAREPGEDDLTLAFALNNLGIQQRKDGMQKRRISYFGDSLKKHERALEIQLKLLGETHVDTARTYANIGRNFLEKGTTFDRDKGKNFEKAEGSYRKALDIMNKLQIIRPQESFDLTKWNQHLVVSLKGQGKYSGAIKTQKLVLSTLLQKHGEDHHTIVLAYHCIAGLLKAQNRFDDALQMLDKAIAISSRLEQLGDFDRTILGLLLRNIAEVMEAKGDVECALELFTKLLMLQLDTLGEMHPATADTYEKITKAYMQKGMVEDGIKNLTKVVEIRRQVLGDDHPDTKDFTAVLKNVKLRRESESLNEQGRAMHIQGDLEKAMHLFQGALDIYREASYVHDQDAADTYENISNVKLDQGFLQDSIDANAEALKIRRRTLGVDHADTIRSMEAHRSLLKRLLVENPRN